MLRRAVDYLQGVDDVAVKDIIPLIVTFQSKGDLRGKKAVYSVDSYQEKRFEQPMRRHERLSRVAVQRRLAGE
jgi:hypothetical protein